MHDESFQRVEEVFQEAADLPIADRQTYLDRACADDAGVRGHVERLLGQLDQDDGPTIDGEPGVGVPGGAIASLREGPGAMIGRYKLLQRIGEGGFGVVYMAEQTEPVVRKVALKIIKLGMDTREVVARFEAERQALALMEHECIARVLDGGATASGRPFFVMELVRGVSITEYCDTNGLGPDERLELFIRVCGAVQHAHQKGLIHRDIKPSNVLVTLNDGKAVPKVIDFGVAKAMHQRLTDKTLFTRYEQFIGTPAYMSPEQAEMSSLDIDTRTDIYSLGVLLYELLTGTTPFDITSLGSAALAEIQRVIREEPAQRPSLQISTTGDAEIARRRRLDTTALSKALRGDLDWIVMRALEKERARRYQTAGELADDVGRHLASKPVHAGPPSRIYAARKLVARNRGLAGAGAFSILALVVAMVAVSIALVRAERSADLAERRADHNEGMMEFLLSTLSLADPQVALTPNASVRTLLDDTAVRVADSFGDQPWSQVRIRSSIGTAYASLGEHALAEPHLRRAVELVDSLTDHGDDPNHPIDPDTFGVRGYGPKQFFDTLWTLTNTAFSLERPDAFAVASRAVRVGLAAIEVESPMLATQIREWYLAVTNGAWSTEPGAVATVPEQFERFCATADAQLPHGHGSWTILADLLMAGGYTLWYTPHESLSESFWIRALEIQRRELASDHPDTVMTVQLIVGIQIRTGRSDQAERLIRDSLDSLRRVHPDGTLLMAMAESKLGDVLVARRKFEQAEPLLVGSYDKILSEIGDASNWMVVEALVGLIKLYDEWDHQPEAKTRRDELVTNALRTPYTTQWPIMRNAFGAEDQTLVDTMDLLRTASGGLAYLSGQSSHQSDDVDDAIARLTPDLRALQQRDPARAVAISRLLIGWANSLDPAAHAADREAMGRLALAVFAERTDTLPGDLAGAHALVAAAAREGGRGEEARQHANDAWEAIRRMPPGGPWFVVAAKVRVARVLIREGLTTQAEPLLIDALQILEAQLGPTHNDTVLAREMLRDLRISLGRDLG